ncbi:MAG TPA: hypothetical protein VFA09_08935 [Ktedonobacteraceae bacterium]|nr:hypothetical protein [Ktedonobacteraceae bacterium]
MHRPKFVVRLLSALSMAMVLALTFGVFAVSSAGAQATRQVSRVNGTPRFYEFHHTFTPQQLAQSALTTWTSSFKSEGRTWTYTMVGTNPSKGSATTTTPVTIVPLLMKFSDGNSFDGTGQVPVLTGSPLFQNAPFISGTTQYGDAVARAEFWNSVNKKSPNYHTLLGTPTIANTVTMNIPSADGATAHDPSTGKLIGLVNINWLDPQLQGLITSMHFTNNMLPIFLSYMVYATAGAPVLGNCCIGGYHNALQNMQTYIWTTQVDEGVQGGFSEDVSASSHEILEWFNDPYTNNVVPNWKSPIAPQYGCNNLLEVGDPLVGVLFTVNGFSSDHLQDVAFFTWFAREKKSKAINHLYTYLGTFTGLSVKC